ncbi:MAG: HD domain-containing protein [Bacteroidetes bacterium]|nr:HD domain-containing protein [Bacteroidota bacterium]
MKNIEHYDFLSTASNIADEVGVELYIVGGFVRDIFLKRTSDEIDFLIVGKENNFVKKFAKKLNVKKINIYKNYGTAQFKFNSLKLEFVNSRKESYNIENRNPKVINGTFEDDIARRDFTINTLAVSLNQNNFGELVDTYNGFQDIEDKIIKTPLDPNKTFGDDPLRIMRAFRFASTLGFDVDEKIIEAAKLNKERIKIVSQERIKDEFLKILSSPKPSIGLKLLQRSEVMSIIFPQISKLEGVDQRKDFHHKEVFLHTCTVVDNISGNTDDVWLRFAALVHDIAKPQTKKFVDGTGWTFHGHEDIGARMMNKIFHDLKLPLSKLNYVKKLVRLHLRPIALAKDEVTDSAIRRFIVEADEDLNDLITLCRADITSKNPQKVSKYLGNYDRVMKKVLEVQEKDKLRAFQSPVRGEEIMKVCNLKPSKKVGKIKKAIEEAILDGIIANNYDEAYNYLLKIKDKYILNKS